MSRRPEEWACMPRRSADDTANRRCRLKTYFVCALVLLGLACSSPTGMCACSPAMARGIVAGVVTNPSGAPSSNVEVRAEVRPFGCSLTSTDLMHTFRAVTDGAGRYRHDMVIAVGSDTACVRIVARSAAGQGSDSVVVNGVRMRFKYSSSNVRPDSLRTHLQLKSPAGFARHSPRETPPSRPSSMHATPAKVRHTSQLQSSLPPPQRA